MFKFIRKFFYLNSFGRTIAKRILTFSILANNPLYRGVYMSIIKRKARELSSALPEEIDIETTSSCNAKCIMCPRSVGRTRPAGIMDRELFYKIIDDCEKIGKKDIGLSIFGEPLVDPYFFQCLEYAKKRGFKVNFFTNGSLLNEEKAKKILDLKCDKITFSIDGFTKEVYESIRVGLDRDMVYKNVNQLLELKKSLGAELPKVDISGILMDKNKEEMEKFLEYWKSRPGIDNVLIASLRNWAGTFDETRIGRLGELSKRNIWRPPCRQLWKGLLILWDGRVSMCCDDVAEARIVIGDLKNQSIEEVWRGRILENLRRLHLGGKQEEIFICKECPRITVWW